MLVISSSTGNVELNRTVSADLIRLDSSPLETGSTARSAQVHDPSAGATPPTQLSHEVPDGAAALMYPGETLVVYSIERVLFSIFRERRLMIPYCLCDCQ